MYNENVTSPVIAMSAWRNQQNSISVLCGIENDSPNALFNSKGGEWTKTAIQTFDEPSFERVFGLDPSLVGSIDDKLELDVNLSELSNKNWTIIVLETPDVSTATRYGILGKNGEIYPSSYKKDKDGNEEMLNIRSELKTVDRISGVLRELTHGTEHGEQVFDLAYKLLTASEPKQVLDQFKESVYA